MPKTKAYEETTLRDEFAGIAMAYYMRKLEIGVHMGVELTPSKRRDIAAHSYLMADVMLLARTKNNLQDSE